MNKSRTKASKEDRGDWGKGERKEMQGNQQGYRTIDKGKIEKG